MWSIGYRGKQLDIPPGIDGVQSISEIATLDLSGMCPECNDGIVQSGPLRIPRYCFNKHTLITEASQMLFWHPILVEEPFVDLLDSRLWHKVELREIQLEGSGTTKNRWFQVIPSVELPFRKFIHPCYRFQQCSTCSKGAWLVKRRPDIDIDQIVSSKWYHDDLAAIWTPQSFARTPYLSLGYEANPSIMKSKKDGRILHFPARGTVLGIDIANQLRSLGDKRIAPEPLSLPLSEAPKEIKDLYQIESKLSAT